VKVFYSDRYTIELPNGHRFPMQKYKMLRQALLDSGVLGEHELFEAEMATREMVLLAHTEEYVDGVLNNTLPRLIQRRIGFPWSEKLVERSLATVGGAYLTACEALESGISGNLAGGTHHALPDAGEGFCVFNDQAIALLQLFKERKIESAAIVDLDVHQGNGNSAILGGRDDIFIFSMHGAKNYPFKKVPSTLDIELADGTSDDEFLTILEKNLPKVFKSSPEIIFYQAGVDPLKEDTLGRISMTSAGLKERDRMVFKECFSRGIPVSMAMGGGYANPIELTVQQHVETYRALKEVYFGERF
jgi:acetoin utilization deacetylase AcuC-like enzyme